MHTQNVCAIFFMFYITTCDVSIANWIFNVFPSWSGVEATPLKGDVVVYLVGRRERLFKVVYKELYLFCRAIFSKQEVHARRLYPILNKEKVSKRNAYLRV